jgi:hypothetical protein
MTVSSQFVGQLLTPSMPCDALFGSHQCEVPDPQGNLSTIGAYQVRLPVNGDKGPSRRDARFTEASGLLCRRSSRASH